MMSLFRCILSILVLMAGAHAQAAESAEQIAQKLLDAMGGANVWRNVRTVHNIAVNHRPQARLPYIQEYWYFTKEPKHIVKINNHDMQRMRAYTTGGGWSIAEGELTQFSGERMQREIQSWSQSLYRKFYLLANDSERLDVRLGDSGRLEFRDNGVFIGWIIVGDDGAPARHGGTPASDVYTDFDALMQFGDIYWPKGGSDEAGWRFEMLSIEALTKEPLLSTDPPAAFQTGE